MVKKNTLIMPEGWHWDMREKRGTLFSPDGEAMARYDLTGQNEKPLWVKGYPPFNLDHIPMEGPAVRKELEKSVLLEIETSKAQETPVHWIPEDTECCEQAEGLPDGWIWCHRGNGTGRLLDPDGWEKASYDLETGLLKMMGAMFFWGDYNNSRITRKRAEMECNDFVRHVLSGASVDWLENFWEIIRTEGIDEAKKLDRIIRAACRQMKTGMEM